MIFHQTLINNILMILINLKFSLISISILHFQYYQKENLNPMFVAIKIMVIKMNRLNFLDIFHLLQ